jgi:hypothetical protein
MSPAGKHMLDALSSLEWFHKVGCAWDDVPNAIIVSGWDEAWRLCQSPEWQHIRKEAWQLYWSSLVLTHPARALKWNELDDELFPIATKLASEKASKTRLAYGLPEEFLVHVASDIFHALMEGEYWDIRLPDFFSNYTINVYHKGHFPCGWVGDPKFGPHPWPAPLGSPMIY